MAKRTIYAKGDRVRLLVDNPDTNQYLYAGATGTVVVCSRRAGVRWDDFSNGNALSGHLTGDECLSGWFVDDDMIEPICCADISDEDIADEVELLAFIGL